MINEKFIKAMVVSVLSQYNLQTVTLDNLVYIVEDQGYEIVEFNLVDTATNHILEKLNLLGCARSRKAFTYKQGLARFVFIFEDLSAEEKMIALAHEVGHIVCKHLREGNIESSIDEEYEANEFAHHLLHPTWWMKAQSWVVANKKKAITIVCAIFVAIIFIVGLTQFIQSRSYYGEYYITENGEKYHKEECIFVKDKNNVERLTEKDYYSGEYEPCQLCLPED